MFMYYNIYTCVSVCLYVCTYRFVKARGILIPHATTVINKTSKAPRLEQMETNRFALLKSPVGFILELPPLYKHFSIFQHNLTTLGWHSV